jgi:hypothetical protein
MSEFKFACPVCGQHIKCDSAKSGSQMECPTCFRKIVVPQAPAGADSKFILTAAQVQSRPVPKNRDAGVEAGAPGSSSRATLVFGIVLVVVACAAAGAVFVFRDKIFKRSGATGDPRTNSSARLAPTPPEPVDPGTNWTLSLADRQFPQTPASGFINRRSFALEKATVQGGLLAFRQGSKTPRELVLLIHLFARQGEDLAGQSVNIEASRTNAPKVVLRWKDDPPQLATQNIREGYALRLEFGQVSGGRLPGKIYLCTPDDAKSWVAGTFEAEIRKPSPPKFPKPPKP